MKAGKIILSLAFLILITGCVTEPPKDASPTYKTTSTSTSTSSTTVSSSSTTTLQTSSTTSTSSTTTTTLSEEAIQILINDSNAEPSSVELKEAEESIFVIRNADARSYNLRNEDLLVVWFLPPDSERRKTYTPDQKGTYELTAEDGVQLTLVIG